jgi:HTH-type transcriptional regulator, transcriptional repressor of NAD biosynthesis genes
VRPWRVVLFGTESTGKSTLAEALARRFDAEWSAEFVREYWDAHGGVIGPGDLDAIARGQAAGEDAAKERAVARGARVVFHDTDVLSCTVWDDLLFPGACPTWVRAEAAQRAATTDLFLFCETDLPWASDPQRCFPDDAGRAMSRQVFLDTLEQTGRAWARVWGATAEREARAVAAVEGMLARGNGSA